MVKGEPVCPACRRHYLPKLEKKPSPGYSTCSSCRRHRKTALTLEDGRKICTTCVDDEAAKIEIAKVDAYWANAFDKRKKALVDSLEQKWARSLATKFADYLKQLSDAHVAAIKLKKQRIVLAEFCIRFSDETEINAIGLLKAYTPEQLRKIEGLVKFLGTQGFELPTQQQLRDASESRRIEEILEEKVPGALGELLPMYRNYLGAKGSKLASQRQALRTAASFAEAVGSKPATQLELKKYLRAKPGQRANLFGFLVFLRLHEIHFDAPPKRRAKAFRVVAKPEDMLAELRDMASNSSSLAELRAACSILLVSALGFYLSLFLDLPRDAVRRRGERLSLTLLDDQVDLTGPVQLAMVRYLALRDTEYGPDGYLFPGRMANRPATPDTISHQLKKREISLIALGIRARAAIKRAAAAA